MRLCRQVAEALSCALATAVDDRLWSLSVLAVEPLCGTSHLRVVLAAGDGDASADERALEGARGYLRSEVAQEIHRKRVPDLHFVVVPPPASSP